jgi:glutaredoxin
MSDNAKATLYRMVLPDHTCPFGLRAMELLVAHGFQVDDRVLRTREEVEAVKEEYGVETTPLVFIGGQRVGGSEELAAFLEDA